jgi:hypothetical protein
MAAMRALPDLSELSHSAKDELICLLWSMVHMQAKQLAADTRISTRPVCRRHAGASRQQRAGDHSPAGGVRLSKNIAAYAF